MILRWSIKTFRSRLYFISIYLYIYKKYTRPCTSNIFHLCIFFLCCCIWHSTECIIFPHSLNVHYWNYQKYHSHIFQYWKALWWSIVFFPENVKNKKFYLTRRKKQKQKTTKLLINEQNNSNNWEFEKFLPHWWRIKIKLTRL